MTDTFTWDTAPYYCDQCGARYAGPGVCTKQHAANELKPTADLTADVPIEPLPPVEPVYGE